MANETVLRFDDVSFGFGENKPILSEVSFSVRAGSKFALMGQNGAGKSTMLWLITGAKKPDDGRLLIDKDATISIARQVIPREELVLTVRDFFLQVFTEKIYDIDARIPKILKVVGLDAPLERVVGSFSGGQQARLLLAQSLITNPDILLLDEPTNNLDSKGIRELTSFLKDYAKTVIVISHDSEFLNAFTQGVLYLNIFTHKVEQYSGDYKDVVREITARLEKERAKNARLEKDIQARKEKANFFGAKGGHMRDVAKKMRDKIEELEGDLVNVRQEDKTIRSFRIPVQEAAVGKILELSEVKIIRDHNPTAKKVEILLKKGEHLLLSGPNGIGKTTLLESIAKGTMNGEVLMPGVVIGYYRQDFSTLDFDKTVYETFREVSEKTHEQDIRSHAAGFMIDAGMLRTRVGSLSEGQKGLVAFATIVLQKPGLLILDEPTNHINFRHIPVIAKALHEYEGAMILVSHVPEFVSQIRIDQELDLGTVAGEVKLKKSKAEHKADEEQKVDDSLDAGKKAYLANKEKKAEKVKKAEKAAKKKGK